MMISRRTRTQTLYYRNLFTRANCERVLDGILTKIDRQSRAALGYELSALFHAMSRVLDLILDRLEQFRRHVMILLNSDSRPEILEVVDFFCSAYPLASRVWRARMDCFTDVDQLRDAGFQLSELSYPWVFTLSRDTLEREFEPPIVEVLYSLSHQKGDLSTAEPDHIYLNNPIWQKPYIRLESGDLFAPLAQLAFSFPFVIVERLMAGHADLKRAYEDARSKYLEDEIVDIVTAAMPNAAIYRGVEWDDPNTGQVWENDVVAQLGNFLFVFEAKSGRIAEKARRGGSLSLRTNFRELFVEPGLQGWRFQNYTDNFGKSASFRLKRDGSLIDLKLDRPKVVYRFSIC